MKKSQLAVICLIAMFQAAPALAQTRAQRAEAIRKNATVSFTGKYEVECPMPVAKAAMQRLLVMGTLWDSYMYGPGYKVSGLSEPGAVHVIDPSGMVGDVWPVSTDGNRLVYLAEGKIDHWAVPMMNTGAAVFDLTLAPKGSGSSLTVTVSVKPESRIAGAALWMLTPVVKGRINSRVTNNIRDAGVILKDISTKPQAVAERLKPPIRQEFELAFVP